MSRSLHESVLRGLWDWFVHFPRVEVRFKLRPRAPRREVPNPRNPNLSARSPVWRVWATRATLPLPATVCTGSLVLHPIYLR